MVLRIGFVQRMKKFGFCPRIMDYSKVIKLFGERKEGF